MRVECTQGRGPCRWVAHAGGCGARWLIALPLGSSLAWLGRWPLQIDAQLGSGSAEGAREARQEGCTAVGWSGARPVCVWEGGRRRIGMRARGSRRKAEEAGTRREALRAGGPGGRRRRGEARAQGGARVWGAARVVVCVVNESSSHAASDHPSLADDGPQPTQRHSLRPTSSLLPPPSSQQALIVPPFSYPKHAQQVVGSIIHGTACI